MFRDLRLAFLATVFGALVIGPGATPAAAENHEDSAAVGMVKTKADLVVAKVGDTEITLGHVIALSLSIPPEERAPDPAQHLEGLLQRLIQQEAIAQQIGDIPKLTQLQAENERRSLLASVVITRVSDSIEISEERITEAYQRRFSGFEPSQEYRASHIVLESEEAALIVVDQLAAGANFADLAREKSIGPTGPNGGDLGWFGPGRMVAAFENTVMGMEPGTVSAPVQTDFGWHVIQLVETRLPSVPMVDEIRDALEQEVFSEQYRDALLSLINAVPIERIDLRAIDPTMINDVSLLE